MKQTINVVTLGCAKNIVDSEIVATLASKNYDIIFDGQISAAKIVIINTCGFIQDAKQESIDTILQFAIAKKNKIIDKLFVMGCLTQLYKNEIKQEIPEIDDVFGVNQLSEILQKLELSITKFDGNRIISTPSHYAFLKIAEGCNRSCSFCSIPIIRGKYISRPIEELVTEAKYLAKKGIKELILISQDTSFYGYDLYKRFALIDLLKELLKIEGLEWIRLQYLYPTSDIYALVDFVSQNPRICKYFDIPFQHINDEVLKSMRRGHSKNDIIEIIKYIRTKIPQAAIRSTFIVAYPNESYEAFDELLLFLNKTKLDRVGFFVYSKEENTTAAKLNNEISTRQKRYRFKTAMELQSTISYELNQKKIGNTFKVLIDRKENNYYVGRTEMDSPEVDNEVLVDFDTKITIGEFYNVEIYDAIEYDLYGKLVDNR